MRSLLSLAFALTACVTDNANNSPAGTNNAGSSCVEIIDCMTDCQTDACANACIDDGSSNARDLFGDLDSCIADNDCPDFDCVEQRCGGELDACFDDTGGGNTGPTGSTLPASLVGAWNASSVTTTAGSITTYIFTADGRVSERSLLTFDDITGCENTFSTEYEGVVLLSGNTLNITVIDGSFTSTKCNEAPTTGPHEDPERFSFATGVDEAGELLQLTNIDNGITVTYRH